MPPMSPLTGIKMTRLIKYVFLFCIHKAKMERSPVTNYVSAKLKKLSKKYNNTNSTTKKWSHAHSCHLPFTGPAPQPLPP